MQEQAGQLAAEGSGVRMTNSVKICGDPKFNGLGDVVDYEGQQGSFSG